MRLLHGRCQLIRVAMIVSSTLGGLPALAAQGNAEPPMDHAAMGHAMPPTAPVDHSQMNHAAMDMGQVLTEEMDHRKMGHDRPAPTAMPRTLIPPLTDADRIAAFPPLQGHAMDDHAINSFLLFDQLEYQDADAGSVLAWNATGWIGGDIDRFWFRSEGERMDGVTEDAEIQALWGHAVGPWWDTVLGVRQDFKPGAPQTWGALGIQGMALYHFEVEATAFLGESGQSAARLEGEYEILLTNRLILQPRLEANAYGKNDPGRGIGSGLADTSVGLRLRYAIIREVAPYIGVSWSRRYGNTADLQRDEGNDTDEARFVAGIRLWF